MGNENIIRYYQELLKTKKIYRRKAWPEQGVFLFNDKDLGLRASM